MYKRQTEDTIEKIGVERARKYAESADLIIYVVDASRKLDDNDQEILEIIQNKKTIVLLNKSDLEMVVSQEEIKSHIKDGIPVISVSAKEEEMCIRDSRQLCLKLTA